MTTFYIYSQNAIENLSKIKNEIGGRAFANFTNHFQLYLKTVLADILKFPQELSEFHETETVIKVNIMAVVYHNIFGNLDQKIFKTLLDCNAKVSE